MARGSRMLGHRLVAAGAAMTLVAATLFAVPQPAAAAAPPLALNKSGPATVLEGDPVRYTLDASNPGSGVAQFNASFRDVLPRGASYVAGSTLPADVDEPTVVTDAGTGATTLIWSDTFDLQTGAGNSISFEVSLDPVQYPVGASVTDTATVYGSTSPRVVPSFDTGGNPISNIAVTASAPDSATTTVTALKVGKAEPSPEAKLLRGVHDQTTVYTLTVSNGDAAATQAVTVTDYLPASLEFLGCGGVDNSSRPEYPGAPRLTGTPAVGADCVTPALVETVNNPAGQPAGVYTAITWNLGTLAANQTRTIKYAAGIPLRQNTLIFPGGAPTPASLGQTANLDNNVGPTTRQNGDAVGLTNHVTATGNYTGPVAPGGSKSVGADTSHTVTENDLRVVKSVTPDAFTGGNIATYTLNIAASEYVNSTGITVTDTVPNGICPLDDTTNHVTGSPADCDPTGPGPSVPYKSVTQNADGTFTVVFDPIDVAHNGTATITYQARMRKVYTGGPLAGAPTATGDSFTNTVRESATTDPRTDITTGESGSATVTDGSSATLTSIGGALSKLMQPRTATQDCSENTYVSPRVLSTTQREFGKGDRICFEVRLVFDTDNVTLNALVSDFLPDGTDYEDGSATLGPANTLPDAQVNFDATGATGGALRWALGARDGAGKLAVAAGSVFEVRFSVIVTDPSPNATPLATSNITKARAENSAGQARSLRARAPFTIDPAPPVSILKGVYSVNGVPADGNPPNRDGVQVAEGDTVVFRVDVSNGVDGTAPVHTVQTWDVLPQGIRCTDIGVISDGGVCTDPGEDGQPSFAQRDTLSAIVWDRPATEVIDPGASVTYTYAMVIPSGTSVDAVLVNTASVRSFDVENNVPDKDTRYFPMANVDTSVPATDQDAPAASDSSNVVLARVGLTKTVLSAVDEAGNIGNEPPPGVASTQATIGEQVTYTVTATIPPHTSVYNGKLTDPLPAGLTLLSATSTTLPDGWTFDPATPSITLPAEIDNDSNDPVVFAMTINARVADVVGNAAGVTTTNSATFTSTTGPTGGTPTPVIATSDVRIVEPGPSIGKTADPGSVVGGQNVTFTLTARNAAGASVLHDGWVADCLPDGLAFVAYGTPSQGTTITPTPGDGEICPATSTQIEWNVGDIAPGAAPALTYTATVTPDATGGQKFVNTATVSGNSLAGARTGPADLGNPLGRPYSVQTTATVTVLGADIVKTVTPTRATIGQTVTYTWTASLQADVTYFNATGLDRLPAGLDPASLTPLSTTCVTQSGAACLPDTSVALPRVTNTDGSTSVGLYFGNIGNFPQPRLITVTYSVRVADVAAAKAGATLTNSARVGWNNTNKGTPASADTPFDQYTSTATAGLTVIEPAMSISKSVDDTTVEPGQGFHYTVTARNSSGVNVSDAYNVTVTDQVPAGVVVDTATISNGGTLAGADGNGAGGTISWLLTGPIAPAAAVELGYDAKLGPSRTLTTAAQTNTATVTGYDSLPSGPHRHYGPSTPTTATVAPQFPSVQTTKSTPLGDRAYVGESFTWKITVTNSGTGTAYHVGAGDKLPPNWSYDNDSAQVSVNGGAAEQVDPVGFAAGDGVRLNWNDLATLGPGQSLTITYTATPQPRVYQFPGVGLSVSHVNTVQSTSQDATGAAGNKTGDYSGPQSSATAHIASADVQITKDTGASPIAGGPGGSWLITVQNNGPDPAEQVEVTDGFNNPLPAGVSNVTAGGTGWTCLTSAPITCTRTNADETLASGASFPVITITYTVSSDVADGTVLRNLASVDARTFDPDLGNNSDTASTTVGTKADLSIEKRLTTALVAGSPASYTIAITNLGPSVSAGPITVTDTLPPGSTFVSAGGTGWRCSPVVRGTVTTVVCIYADDVALGELPDEIVMTVGIPSAQTADVVNTARITDTTTPDPNPDNDSSTVTTPVTTSADLDIQKEHVGTFVAGEDAVYTLTVHNYGPSDAADGTIIDTLPDTLTYVSAQSAGAWTCSAAGQKVTCTHDTPLPADGETVISLTVHVDPGVTDQIENSATVSSTTADPILENNTDSDKTGFNRKADLAITKTHTGDAVAGRTLSFTLTASNKGPSTIATTVTVTDVLPAGLTYGNAAGAGWTCDYTAGTRTVTCARDGLAANTDAPDITLQVDVDPDVVGTLVNPADVHSDVDDPDLTNNHAEDIVDVGVEVNLSLTKTLDTPTPVLAGTDVTFTLQAENTGPSDAVDVVVTDTLGDHLSFVSASGAGWSCAKPFGSHLLCARDRVPAEPPGDPVPPITVVAKVDPSTPIDPPDGTTTLVNSAKIDTSSPGMVTNPDPVPVPVVARADLTLTKTPSVDPVSAGDTLTWTFVAHNKGPSIAAGPLTLTDTLPAGESYLSAAAPWTCTPGPSPATSADRQDVTCTLADSLAQDADAVPLKMLVQIAADAPVGDQVNTATVGSPTPGGDGTGTGTVTVQRAAKLTITKTHSGHGVVGQPLDFRLAVHNAGPSIADHVVVTDPLPKGLTYVSATGTDWTCSGKRNEVRCALAGTLGVGANAPQLTLTVRVGAAAYPKVTNVATVFSTNPELPGKASDDDVLIVDPDAALAVTKQHTGTFVVGSQGRYVVAVTNTGPTATPGPITISDPLPNGLSYVSASGSGWVCSARGRLVTCTRAGPLGVDASTSVALVVDIHAAAAPSVVNTATATAPGGPPASADDTAPVQVPPSTQTGGVAFTGVDSAQLLLAALCLIALGILMLVSSRRRSG